MENRIVKSIVLSGSDAITFVNSLFRPTVEEIYRKKEILDNIDKTVQIIRDGENFSASVEGLDLSFIKKDTNAESSFFVDTPFKVSLELDYYDNSKQKGFNNFSIYESKSSMNDVYCSSTRIVFQSWAA